MIKVVDIGTRIFVGFDHNLYLFWRKFSHNYIKIIWQFGGKYILLSKYPKPICVICSLLRNQKVIFFQGYHKQISQDQELCVFSFFPSQILDDGTYWEKRTLRGNTKKTIFSGTILPYKPVCYWEENISKNSSNRL